MDTTTQDTVKHIVDTITQAYSVERIFLFGSRAGGRCQPDSDYDLLVVANMPGISAKNRPYLIRKLFPSRDFSLDVIVKSPHEFAAGRETRNHICRIVEKEGLVVYGN